MVIFGKAIGGDILNNKKTWLLTRAFEKAGDLRPRLLAAMDMPVESEEQKALKISEVTAIYELLGLGNEAKEEIARLHGQALDYVVQLGLAPEAETLLKDYAAKLIGRNK